MKKLCCLPVLLFLCFGVFAQGTDTTGKAAASGSFTDQTAVMKPLYVVDGKVYAGNINTLSRRDIKSITVLKSAEAIKRYGAFNASEVIEVETGRHRYNFNAQQAGTAQPALADSVKYVIDGVVASNGLDGLNPDDILSITVLKDASAHPEYGTTKNGFVLVNTKAGAVKKYQHTFAGLSADYKKYLDEHNNDDSALNYSVDGAPCDKGQDGITRLFNLTKEKIAKIKLAKSGTEVEITTKK